jgi:Ni/Fe-hydrogenase subunit HybB-like protein
MQGFIIFWGYIGFSQFMLIWYANIPEETFWYNLRINQPGWKTLSLILLVGHLFIPFFLLMGRALRRNRQLLTISAVFILIMHWVDHYWLIMPQMNPEAKTYTLTGSGILTDICCTIGVIGIYIALFCLITRNRPLVPLKDPRLGEALNHEVH